MTNPDKLSIDTPEQIALEYDIAGIGSRFLACALDSLIQVGIFVVLGIAFAVVGSSIRSAASSAGTWAAAIIGFVFFLLYWGYFTLFELLWSGQTPGKRVAGIRVINESGREVRLFEAAIRNLLRAVDWLPGFYGVGIVCMFVNARNKRVGDFLAGTIVVHDRKPAEEALFFNTRDVEIPFEAALASITANDVRVIEAFLQRRLDLDPSVRRATAFKLAEHFGNRCTIAQSERLDDENFLEFLVRGFRRSPHARTQRAQFVD